MTTSGSSGPCRGLAVSKPSTQPGGRVEWLPKYAPELNDIEGVWRDLKRHHLAHQTFSGPEDLNRAIQDAVMKLNTERNRHLWANQQIAA